jgi:hypothetical protein
MNYAKVTDNLPIMGLLKFLVKIQFIDEREKREIVDSLVRIGAQVPIITRTDRRDLVDYLQAMKRRADLIESEIAGFAGSLIGNIKFDEHLNFFHEIGKNRSQKNAILLHTMLLASAKL